MQRIRDILGSVVARLRLPGPLLNRVWFVCSPAALVIRATPGACVQTLAVAAKPSTKRLHLRNLFASGRRYQLHLRGGGFTLTTTSQVLWRYRKRTSAAAVLLADLSAVDAQITRIQLRVRISLIYLLDAFLIPTFVLSILIFVPWPPPLIAALLAGLYLLSWFGHRHGAALEANEMIFFVQKALEEFVPAEILALDSTSPDVIQINREFGAIWEEFYQAHRDQ